MSKEYDPKHRQAVINGLRELADFLAEHPDVPVPAYPDLTFHVPGSDEEQRAEVDRIADALGVEPVENKAGTHYRASRTFGGVEFTAGAISAAAMRRHEARRSYSDNIQAETETETETETEAVASR